MRRSGPSSYRSPTTITWWVHPSMSPYPFRVPSLRAPAYTFRCKPACPGFRSSSRYDRIESTYASFHTRFVPSSGFRSLSTVYSSSRRRRLVSSHNHVQDSPVQGVLSPRSRTLSSKVVAPVPLRPTQLSVRKRSHSIGPSTSRLCSTRRSVRQVWVLASPSIAPLFGFLPPPGSSSLPCASVTQRNPLMNLLASNRPPPEGNFWLWRALFSVFPASPAVCPSLSRPTCSRFRAFFSS